MNHTTQPQLHQVHSAIGNVTDYVTKDGSIIRELLHPESSAVRNQSLAEARVAPGEITALHLHALSEEIYHITQGTGCMRLGNAEFDVQVGDSVVIAPGTPHCIRNIGADELRILCACSPAYSHADTQLL
ncbi:MAG: cupin domain-containing protein [Burkholderiales bacterium]|jgi:mannose-6-phosphate isomerase-like protein (cupin superfamily)|nr:cupin domain-containing protein [Nitrosomonadaceae bacterium]